MKRARQKPNQGEFDLHQLNAQAAEKELEESVSEQGSSSGSESDQIASGGEDSSDDSDSGLEGGDVAENGVSDDGLDSEDELVAMDDSTLGKMPQHLSHLSKSTPQDRQADFEESIQHGKGVWHTRDSSTTTSSSTSSSSSSSSSSSTTTTAPPRIYKGMEKREEELAAMEASGSLEAAKYMHIDDLSSDDEEAGNTIGNVPLHWYDDHDHIGYGLDGKRIAKKVSARGDGLDRYLASKDDPNYRRTVYDAKNDREVVLTDRQMELIRNMLSGGYAHPEFNDHQEFVPFFSQNVQIHPLTHAPAPKARFLPDKWERQKVLKIAQAIKEGRIVIGKLCEVV